MFDMRSTVACLCAWTLAACGGGAQGPAQTPTPKQPASEEQLAWKDMNRAQRQDFMGLTVLPEMQALFRAQNPNDKTEFKCQTCHGEDMQAVDFKMPNGLFELSATDPIAGAKEYDALTTQFMQEIVSPKMAQLLGQEPAKTTCFTCHGSEG
jgi:hypothetical protein